MTSPYRHLLPNHTNRCPPPFLPFAPLGLGLFDTDPSRSLLNLLHHQTLIAEEALRYRGIFLPTTSQKESIRYNPIAEMLSKEHQELFFRRSALLRENIRYPMMSPDIEESIHKRKRLDSEESTLKFGDESPSNSKEVLDEILSKRSGSYFKEGLRYNPISIAESSNKDKSSSSSTSSSPLIKPIHESLLLKDSSSMIEEETKCTVCNANFPSVWLLEQHAALQHANLGPMEEKPFICDQCGQSYRYRSAYVKHREQNHRARLPADKLFTCDICGMQFRYLKSFKKHRLNHALERIHGKNEKRGASESSEMVSSTNEAVEDVDLKGIIKEEDEDEEQDATIDSALYKDEQPETRISSSEMERGEGVLVKHISLLQKPEAESSSALSIATTSINSLISPERMLAEATLGLNPQEASLLNFLRADAAEKQRERRFACPFCGKCVRSKENLKLHVRKHTGERPFVCLFCGRAFGGKSDLTRHLRIHTGERPYSCEACGKCFARADYLSKHLTTHLHNTGR